MARVAVVILNYNGREFLKKFLPILIQHTPNAELIVADNCSTDDSLSILLEFSGIKVIKLKENHGFAGGYNEALSLIKNEYYFLLNSDVEVTDQWLEPLVSFLDSHPNYAAIQPKLLDYNNRNQFEYAGAAGGYIDSLGYPYCRGRIFQKTETDLGQYDSTSDVFWVSGAAFLIRSEAFHRVGGFDASFFAHMEEIDLCWRLQSHNYKLACGPISQVFHVGGGTLSKTNPKKTYLNFRNGLRLLVKNLPVRQLFYKLPLRLIIDLLASFHLLLTESTKHSTAVYKAYWDATKNLKADLKNSLRSDIHRDVNGARSIVFAHFLRKTDSFTDLNSTK